MCCPFVNSTLGAVLLGRSQVMQSKQGRCHVMLTLQVDEQVCVWTQVLGPLLVQYSSQLTGFTDLRGSSRPAAL